MGEMDGLGGGDGEGGAATTTMRACECVDMEQRRRRLTRKGKQIAGHPLFGPGRPAPSILSTYAMLLI